MKRAGTLSGDELRRQHSVREVPEFKKPRATATQPGALPLVKNKISLKRRVTVLSNWLIERNKAKDYNSVVGICGYLQKPLAMAKLKKEEVNKEYFHHFVCYQVNALYKLARYAEAVALYEADVNYVDSRKPDALLTLDTYLNCKLKALKSAYMKRHDLNFKKYEEALWKVFDTSELGFPEDHPTRLFYCASINFLLRDYDTAYDTAYDTLDRYREDLRSNKVLKLEKMMDEIDKLRSVGAIK